MICATICEASVARAIRVAGLLASRVDLFEVRLDALADPDPAALVAGIGKPVILTCRAPEDGGSFSGTPAGRLDLLRRGIGAGAAWIDVEDHAADALGDRGDSRLILSHHDFAGMPDDPAALVARMAARGPDVVKLVPTARRPEDVLCLFELIRGSDVPLAAHAMGPATVASRVLGALAGSAIVYGAALPGAAGAPGQPTVRDLVEEFRVGERVESVVLLFGGDLSHSVSPAMLNGWFRARGVAAVSVPWPVADASVIPAILRETGAIGAAVTIPHKGSVMEHLDSIDDDARRIGAVNTIVVREGGLHGSNTDLAGALTAIRRKLPDLAGCRALVVGAGGAARSIARGLSDADVRVFVWNRTPDRAESLAADVGGEVARDGGEYDLVVNATPVGQWPDVDQSPVPPEALRSRPVVFDAVYNPMATKLLREARRMGCETVPGLEMLAGQAVEQVRLWFGVEAGIPDVHESALDPLERRTAPLVLIGLRGVGKSTVGRLLADRLRRPFADLDEEIEASAGKSISRIFEEDGEGRFREMERDALAAALGVPGRVVATGGGVVSIEDAHPEGLPFGARVVLLTATAEVMADRIRGSARPPLTGLPLEAEVRHLLAERGGRQREAAGVVVDTTNLEPGEVVIEVLNSL